MNDIQFDDRGLVPAIVRDARNGTVLTLAYMNEESMQKTLESGETWFWSRSRRELWHKGATSGHLQRVLEMRIDCDQDAIWLKVEQGGAGACHTGRRSCFYRSIPLGGRAGGPIAIEFRDAERTFDPQAVYARKGPAKTP